MVKESLNAVIAQFVIDFEQMNRQKKKNEEKAKQQQMKNGEVLFSDFSDGLGTPAK
jgi:hypothetical protein